MLRMTDRGLQALLADAAFQLQFDVNAPGILRTLHVEKRRIQVIQFRRLHVAGVLVVYPYR